MAFRSTIRGARSAPAATTQSPGTRTCLSLAGSYCAENVRTAGRAFLFRYLMVECLTAALFVFASTRYGLPLALVYWIFLALLIAATFIDIEHFIIPDEITRGGTAAGLLFSILFPQMMQTNSRLEAFGFSLAAAAFGYGLLRLIVEFGKLAFGRKRHRFEKRGTVRFAAKRRRRDAARSAMRHCPGRISSPGSPMNSCSNARAPTSPERRLSFGFATTG